MGPEYPHFRIMNEKDVGGMEMREKKGKGREATVSTVESA